MSRDQSYGDMLVTASGMVHGQKPWNLRSIGQSATGEVIELLDVSDFTTSQEEL